MKNKKLLLSSFIIIASALILSACTSNNNNNSSVEFSNEEEIVESVSTYTDKLANEIVNISKSYNLNQEFKAEYKTVNPDGVGMADFKAKSMKEVSEVDQRTPEDGKKLVLVEISVRGNSKNKGEPATFNQIGDNPSPQFVLVDTNNNKSYVEETYYSDAYTVYKKLFELSKITLDHDQWVNTALVFQIDKNLVPDLAFRFTNLEGKTEFYDIK